MIWNDKKNSVIFNWHRKHLQLKSDFMLEVKNVSHRGRVSDSFIISGLESTVYTKIIKSETSQNL